MPSCTSTDKRSKSSSSLSFSPTVAILVVLLAGAFAYSLVPAGEPLIETATTEAGIARIDTRTGFVFSQKQNFQQAGKHLQLLGLGTRKNAIINVYSVAFYGSEPVVNAIKKKEKSNSKKTSKCEIIMESKGTKAVQLIMNMALTAGKMAEALSNIDGVAQGIKDAFGNMVLKGINGKLLKREGMTLEWKYPDIVAVTARGKFLGEIKDTALYKGLLAVYLGPKSVSPLLKQDIEAFEIS